MRVLLDTWVPRPSRKHLAGHEVSTAQEMGWDSLENGALIRVAEGRFDVLITSDQHMKHQQTLHGHALTIRILPTNHLPMVLRLATKMKRALDTAQPGTFVEIPLD
ncbi:MAG: hypothetical protein N3I86_02845 [Verrucomicrobiae bacterium]|nr:hypothetical protein [Verrucomicrobiae bacterium]